MSSSSLSAASAQETHVAINIQQEPHGRTQDASTPDLSEAIVRKPFSPPRSHAQVPFLLLISSFCMWSNVTILDNHLFSVNDNVTASTSHLWGFFNLVQQAIFVPVMYVILNSARRKAPPAPIIWAFLLGIVSNTQSSTIVSILSQFPLRLTSTVADGSQLAAVVDTRAVTDSYHFAYAAYGGYAAMVGCHLFRHMSTVCSTGFTTAAQKIAFAFAIAIHSFTIAIVITAPGDYDAAIVSGFLAILVALLIKEAYATGSGALLPIGSRPVLQFYIISYVAALSIVGLAAVYVYGGRALGFKVGFVSNQVYSLTM